MIRMRSRRFLYAMTVFLLVLFATLLVRNVVIVQSQSVDVNHQDVLYRIDVVGANPGGLGWADSYSNGDECYCDISSFDHNAGVIAVETPFGWKTVREVCENIIGAGPGVSGRPIYNDVQCGNGPPNDAGDEHVCPGRTDIGPEGCGHIGPKWKFPTPEEAAARGIEPTPVAIPETAHEDIVATVPVPGTVTPGGAGWGDSYSVGDQCYCASTFDHGIGTFMVQTASGWMSVRDVCDILGPGPGIDGRPVYNDVQCGNGPPNDAGDEQLCPGRTDIGPEGCGQVGPKWNLQLLCSDCTSPTPPPTFPPTLPPTLPPTPIPLNNPTLKPTLEPTTTSPTLKPTLEPTTTSPTLKPSSSSPSASPVKSETPTQNPTPVPLTLVPTTTPSMALPECIDSTRQVLIFKERERKNRKCSWLASQKNAVRKWYCKNGKSTQNGDVVGSVCKRTCGTCPESVPSCTDDNDSKIVYFKFQKRTCDFLAGANDDSRREQQCLSGSQAIRRCRKSCNNCKG